MDADWIETGVDMVDVRRVALSRLDGTVVDLVVVRNTKALPPASIAGLTASGFVPFGTQSHAALDDNGVLDRLDAMFPASRRVRVLLSRISKAVSEEKGTFPVGPPVASAPAKPTPADPLTPRAGSSFAPAPAGPARRRPGPFVMPVPREEASVVPPTAPVPAVVRDAIDPPAPIPSSAPGAPVPVAGEREPVNRVADPKALQLPYEAGSRIGVATSMVPRALSEPTRRALARLRQHVGDIDDYVAGRAGWTLEEMGKAIAAEQVDAVALILFANEEDRAFVLADMAGVGKGRVIATLIRIAVIEGRKSVFFTEKPNLFSDIYRDIADIGSLELVGRPFILNYDVQIEHPVTKETVFGALEPDFVKRTIKSRRFPEGFNLVIAGYPQVNEGVDGEKAAFLRTIVAEVEGDVILDECHNAAGDSSTSEAIDSILAEARNIVWSSATFAKVAANLRAYRRLLPPSMRSSDLEEVLTTGGKALAEALTQMLAESGSYLRREHDLSRIPIDLVVDHARLDRNRAMNDALAPILSGVSTIAFGVKRIVQKLNEEAEAKGRRELWSTGSFGSRLSVISRQFSTALLVDVCVERGLEHIRQGRKPIPVVESTMESLMRELAEDGDPIDPIVEEGTSGPAGQIVPTFRDVLNVMVDRTLQISVRKPKSKKPEKSSVDDEDLLRQVETLKRLIEGFPDLPMSPLDEMRERYAAEGLTFAEVSARGMRIEGGRYVPAPKLDRLGQVAGFNDGTYDVIGLTRAGSTGLSLHASEKFADQRQRVMQELQIAQNVGERSQFHGRGNRRGQISEPIIETYSTGMPFQVRNLAIQNRKYADMSASTTGTSRSMASMDVLDILNPIGNDVAKEMLESQPMLARRLDIAMKLADMEEAEANLYHVDKIMARLIMLPSAEQERIFDELVAAYEARIADMLARGETPHGEGDLPGEWTIVSREVLEPAVEADGPVFGAPVLVTTLAGSLRAEPWTSAKVQAAVADSWRRKGVAPGTQVGKDLSDIVRRQRRKALQKALPVGYLNVEMALASAKPNQVKDASQRMERLATLVEDLRPGHMIQVTNDDGIVTGTVIDLVPPAHQDEYHRPGSWTLRYVMPGDERARSMSLAGYMSGKTSLHAGDRGRVPAHVLARFDAVPRGVVEVRRKVIDGNPVKAVMVARREGWSSLVSWHDRDGIEHKGVLVPKSRQAALDSLPGRVSDPGAACAVAQAGAEIWTHPDGSEKGASLVVRGRRISFSVPSGKKARKAFETPAISRLAGSYSEDTRPTASIPTDRLRELIDALAEAGHAFHYPGEFRHVTGDVVPMSGSIRSVSPDGP